MRVPVEGVRDRPVFDDDNRRVSKDLSERDQVCWEIDVPTCPLFLSCLPMKMTKTKSHVWPGNVWVRFEAGVPSTGA